MNVINKIYNKIRAKYLLSKFIDPLTGLKFSSNFQKEKLGGEAGWVVPTNVINENSICYFCGAGEDISFDIDVVKKFKANVHIFDPTPRAIAHFNKLRDSAKLLDNVSNLDLNLEDLNNISFHPIGVWDEETTLKFFAPENPQNVSHSAVNLQRTNNYFEAKVEKLSTVMKRLNHNSLDILKLDIEGAEYKVLDSVLKDAIKIHVLCVEFDEAFFPIDDQYKDRIKTYLLKFINLGFEMINVSHPGNYTLINKSYK